MELICDKEEVLRYLGYRGQTLSAELSELIDKTMLEAEEIVTPRYCISEYAIEKTQDGIYIKENGMLLSGGDIVAHLNDCTRIITLVATIGVDLDRRIHLHETQNLIRAMILDCCGSSMIETYCNNICEGINNKIKERKLFMTTRFSPGYGDLPLSLQSEFLRVTNAARLIGVNCNENFLMFPRKSVTAIIGLSPNQINSCSNMQCDTCSMKDKCIARRRTNI